MSQLTQPYSSRNASLAFITPPLARASSACGSRPTLSTAGAMSRAMAMTALINKLTSRPFVFFGMFHPSPRERRRQRLTRCGTRLLAAAVPERSRQSRGLGQPPERPRRPPLTDHSAGEVLHRVVQLALL